MNLNEKERAHYDWQRKTYFESVGKFVSEISLLEGFMMDILSIYFTRDKRKREDLFNYVLADTSIKVVSEIFNELIKNEFQDFYLENRGYLDQIPKFIKRRNLICHSHFHADENFIRLYDTKKVLIRDIRRFKTSKEFIKHLSLKEQDKYIEDLASLNSLVN